MNIPAKKYAEALYESVRDKSKEEVKDTISRFFDVLVANGDVSKAEATIQHFMRHWDEAAGIRNIEVTSASELSKTEREAVKAYAAEKFASDQIEISEKIDPAILGGIVLRDGDRVYDNSVKGRVYSLREKINN